MKKETMSLFPLNTALTRKRKRSAEEGMAMVNNHPRTLSNIRQFPVGAAKNHYQFHSPETKNDMIWNSLEKIVAARTYPIDASLE